MNLPSSVPTALVTGAARGIGLAVTQQLAAAGFHVLVGARALEQARTVVDELVAAGRSATAVRVDHDDPASIDALARSFEEAPLDVVVANAAAFPEWSETVTTADLSSAERVLKTNLLGTWHVLQATVPAVRRSASGRVVVVTSGAGSFGEPQFGLTTGPSAASYAVSKAALNALVVKLAVELQADGVLVNAVDPGLTATAPGMEAMGARPVEDGAASVVWAATLPAGGPSGTFTRDGRPLAW